MIGNGCKISVKIYKKRCTFSLRNWFQGHSKYKKEIRNRNKLSLNSYYHLVGELLSKSIIDVGLLFTRIPCIAKLSQYYIMNLHVFAKAVFWAYDNRANNRTSLPYMLCVLKNQ